MLKRIGFLLLALLLLAGCTTVESPDPPGTVWTDGVGRAVSGLPENPRAVALSASIGEIWLEAGGQLLGVTEDAFEEREILERGAAESVGSVKNPNVEAALALEPDLVLLSPDIAGQVEAAAVFESAGIPFFYVTADGFQSYAETMAAFTGMLGTPDRYEQYVSQPAQKIEEIKTRSAGAANKTTLILRAYSSGVTVKTTGVCAEIVHDFGITDIAESDGIPLEELSLEVILERDPERILIVTMGDEDAARAYISDFLTKSPLWGELSAVASGRVNYLPKELFHYKPNGRWEEAYSYLHTLFFG
jgi:iron complex transport system substrate-binding protein